MCQSLACQSLAKDCTRMSAGKRIKLKKYGLRIVVLIRFQEIGNIPKIIDVLKKIISVYIWNISFNICYAMSEFLVFVFQNPSLEGTFLINDKMICKFQFSEFMIMKPFKHRTSPEGTIVPGELKQNFVMKVYIVITSKVFADFCFESPISIDFQSEILALLPPKSAKTFDESLQILSPLRKSA